MRRPTCQICSFSATSLAVAVFSAVLAQNPPVKRAEPIVDPSDRMPPVKRAESVDPPPAVPVGPETRPATVEPRSAPAKPGADGRTPGVSPEQTLFDYANLCYGQKAYDLAIQQYTEYLRTYPRGQYVQPATYRLGEAYYALSQITEAEKTYRQLVSTYRSGEWVGNAAYRLASLAYNKKSFAEAAGFFETAAGNTKQEKVKMAALYYRGRSLLEDGKGKLAYPEFQKLAKVRENNQFWERAALQVARMDEAAKRSEESLAAFQMLAREAVDPEVRGEALVKSGLIQSQTGKSEDAIASFQKAMTLKDDKSAEWRAIGRYGLIESFYKAGEWQKVAETYANTEAVQLSENLRAKMWLMVGNAQRSLKQYRRAIDMYLMIDQYYPSSAESAEAGYKRLVCLNELKDPSLPSVAEEVIDRIKSINPASEQIDLCRFLVAENYFVRREYKLAAKAYTAIRTDKVPENLRGPLLFRRGWSCAEAGDNTNAITAFSQFLDGEPKDPLVPEALAKRGMAYKAAEDLKNAQTDFDAIVARFPTSSVSELAHEQSGLVRGLRKDTQGMIDVFTEMLKRFPQSKAAGEAWFWIGSGLFDLRKWTDALPALAKSRELDAKSYDQEASLKIVLCYYYLQDVAMLAKAVEAERSKDNGDQRVPKQVYQFLGLKYFEQGDMNFATRYLALCSTPEKPDDTHPQIWYNLSESRLAIGLGEGALEAADHYLKAVNAPASKTKGMLNRARALYSLKRYDEASQTGNDALRLEPEARVQANLRMLLGDVAAAQGNFENAAQHYVLPSAMFEDPEITPLALWKTMTALQQAGKTEKAAEFQKDLARRFPKWHPPKAS